MIGTALHSCRRMGDVLRRAVRWGGISESVNGNAGRERANTVTAPEWLSLWGRTPHAYPK